MGWLSWYLNKEYEEGGEEYSRPKGVKAQLEDKSWGNTVGNEAREVSGGS